MHLRHYRCTMAAQSQLHRVSYHPLWIIVVSLQQCTKGMTAQVDAAQYPETPHSPVPQHARMIYKARSKVTAVK
jgi:hypothetical protein